MIRIACLFALTMAMIPAFAHAHAGHDDAPPVATDATATPRTEAHCDLFELVLSGLPADPPPRIVVQGAELLGQVR